MGEPFPIHGNGFSSAWTVESQTASAVDLFLGSCGPGRYSARAAYGLLRGALTMRACVINRSDEPLPFGLGFHPWIVRTPDTRLKALAETVLLESANDLPAGAEPTIFSLRMGLRDAAQPSWPLDRGAPLSSCSRAP